MGRESIKKGEMRMSMPDMEDETMLIYAFVRDYLKHKRYSPTFEEIADGCYLARSTVYYRMGQLEARDWLVRELNVPRTIRLGEHAPDYIPDDSNDTD